MDNNLIKTIMKKEDVLNNIEILYKDLDDTTFKLVSARANKDTKLEAEALFEMESLIVSCQQELSFLYDYINQNCHD